MENIIKNSLEKAISYQEYRNLVTGLLKEGKSTGPNQSEDLLHYSKLNNSRMKRLDKTFTLSDKTTSCTQNLIKKYTFLVISEGWCGDAAQVLPIINKVAESSENIDLKIVLRDENEALMNLFLTNGSMSIPKLILLETETNKVVNSWGPRPSEATKMVAEQKEKYGVLDADFKERLQVWYNTDKGQNIEDDLLKLLNLNCA
ncbi:thioredoxin family protein [Aureibaculum sp. 2210JD6-5]|uniref:thioredoxin family protein n=1 Tax=Aureibaculum sp. 2210JD6-5 TaxID=3103957 RepID=UPI002AAD2E93|nr:thioredoxin family protein [Aureibaculum sp. 2210JD6-5]MDY7394941.1 thioredoxin family protein [Aureibaculum sp. 2210JD6-5]